MLCMRHPRHSRTKRYHYSQYDKEPRFEKLPDFWLVKGIYSRKIFQATFTKYKFTLYTANNRSCSNSQPRPVLLWFKRICLGQQAGSFYQQHNASNIPNEGGKHIESSDGCGHCWLMISAAQISEESSRCQPTPENCFLLLRLVTKGILTPFTTFWTYSFMYDL